MIQHDGFVDGAGVVVQAPGDGEIHGEVVLGHSEGAQIFHHGPQLLQALVKDLAAAPVGLQGGEHFCVGAGDGDELQNFGGGVFGHAPSIRRALTLSAPILSSLSTVRMISPGLVGQALHVVEAGEDLPVVHPDLELLQAQGGEGLVDDGGNLRLVGDIQLAVADDVDVALVKLPEPARWARSPR